MGDVMPDSGRYRTIVVDPPWHYEDRFGRYEPAQRTGRSMEGKGAPHLPMHYKTMTVTDIAALPVMDLAASDAHLYLWTTQRYLEPAFEIVREWGFDPRSVLVWCKGAKGLGGGRAFICSTEFVIFAVRGKLAPLSTQMGTWFQWPRREHSAKPEAFIDLVEQVSPGPYVELFARRARFGWDYWGDESLGTVTMEDVA